MISLAKLQLTDDRRLDAPTPIIAVTFVCVVLVGMPNIDDMKRQLTADKSAENPDTFQVLPYPSQQTLLSYNPL